MNKVEYIKLKNMLNKYFKKEMYIDEKFIYDAIEIIVKSRKLDSMINDVNIFSKNEKKDIAGSYSPIYKNIEIVLPQEKKDIFTYNSTIMHILLHELEHVVQHKKCNERKNNSLETDLLMMCFKANNYLDNINYRLENDDIKPYEMESIIMQLDFYQKYSRIVNRGCYEFLPSERQAEINSFDNLIQLFKNMKLEKYNDQIKGIEVGYLIRKIMGYKKIDDEILAPTYELYKNILIFLGKEEDIKSYYEKFDYLADGMDLDKRLYYGLKISQDEYDIHNVELANSLIKCKNLNY